MIFAEELISFHQPGFVTPKRISLGAGHQEAHVREFSEDEPLQNALRNFLNHCRVYHFHDTSQTARIRQFCYVGDNRWLMPDAANLAAVLYRLKSENDVVYRRIVRNVAQVAPFFVDFDLEPSGSEQNGRHSQLATSEFRSGVRPASTIRWYVACDMSHCALATTKGRSAVRDRRRRTRTRLTPACPRFDRFFVSIRERARPSAQSARSPAHLSMASNPRTSSSWNERAKPRRSNDRTPRSSGSGWRTIRLAIFGRRTSSTADRTDAPASHVRGGNYGTGLC